MNGVEQTHMKTYISAALVLFACLPALAEDLRRYEYFQRDGIYDPGVSNEAANALVADGMLSTDPTILNLTIRALGDYASHLVHDRPSPYGSLPSRSFHEVDGLKDFLIDHWRSQHASSGYNRLGTVLTELGVPDGVGPDEWTEHVDFGEDQPLDNVVDFVHERISAWGSIPGTLCALWPKDPDVLRLVWDYHATDQSPTISLTTLSLLNSGRYDTAEANAFRLKELSRPSDDRMGHIAVSIAAEGLALSQPREALIPLISAGMEHPSAIRRIVTTIAGYSDQQLAQHAGELGDLLTRSPAFRPMSAEGEALDRLRLVMDAISDE